MSIRRLIAPTAALVLLAAPAVAETVAFTGATIHPVSSEPIADGVLVVDDGVISAVGAGLAVPDGARVVELAGKHLYPGFVHPSSQLGLIEIDSVRGTRDDRETGEVNASIRAEVAFHADSMLLPVAISGGVLTAHVYVRGGAFMGSSAVMKLDGWTWEDMTIAAPVGQHVDFPVVGGGDDDEASSGSDEAMKTLREVMADARAYRKAVEAGTAPGTNRDLEALLPVLAGELSLFVHAESEKQISAALDWAAEEELERIVLVTGPDARYVSERLAAEDVPVILEGVNRLPQRRWEPYDAAYTAAAALHAAGVRFAIADGGDAAMARNLPFEAAQAAAFGLDPDAALKSVTLWPAEILGVGDRLGSLEEGKDATFIVTDGDPLEIVTSIEAAWIGGVEVDRSRDKQRQLWERYRNRPMPAAETSAGD